MRWVMSTRVVMKGTRRIMEWLGGDKGTVIVKKMEKWRGEERWEMKTRDLNEMRENGKTKTRYSTKSSMENKLKFFLAAFNESRCRSNLGGKAIYTLTWRTEASWRHGPRNCRSRAVITAVMNILERNESLLFTHRQVTYGWCKLEFCKKNDVIWDVMPCGSCKNRCFGDLAPPSSGWQESVNYEQH
jgi:hypothetical protein